MGVAENKKVALDFLGALHTGNGEAIQAALADDATWWVPGSLPISGTYEGKRAIFDDFLSKIPVLFEPGSPVSMQLRDVIGEGDSVAVEYVLRSKSAKGSDYENDYHLKFKVKEGKIQTIREYCDTLYAKEVLVD